MPHKHGSPCKASLRRWAAPVALHPHFALRGYAGSLQHLTATAQPGRYVRHWTSRGIFSGTGILTVYIRCTTAAVFATEKVQHETLLHVKLRSRNAINPLLDWLPRCHLLLNMNIGRTQVSCSLFSRGLGWHGLYLEKSCSCRPSKT